MSSRQRGQRGRTGRGQSSDNGESILAEAEALQQRAERRRGQDAFPAYQQAVEKFKQAIAAGLPQERLQDAFLGLGEVLQTGAGALLEATAALPDDQLSVEVEEQAMATASDLYQQSVAAYQQVVVPSGAMQVEASVNCGNTLAYWADMVEPGDPAAAVQLLQQAVTAYQSALAQEEDASMLSNLADALAALAASMCRCGGWGQAEEVYRQSMEAFELACGMTDSAAGDDLPGLLYNWAVAMQTMSGHVADPTAKASMLDAAAAKFRDAINFDRGDAGPHNGLGDVVVERAELAGSRDEAVALLQEAMLSGYQAALNISRTNTDALVGMAESHVALARLAQSSGDAQAAQAHFQQSATFYRQALHSPTKLGRFKERCEVRYNAACAMALAGDEQGAQAQLQGLLSLRATSAAELLSDLDFQGVAGQPWFQELIAASQPSPPLAE